MMKLFAFASVVAATTVVSFDGAASTTFQFKELSDPVMGGKSSGTWALNETGGFGIFEGKVLNVPALKAPGFIKIVADGKFVSVADQTTGDLVLMVRSKTPEYTGFRVALAAGTKSPSYACGGGSSLPFSGGCYKAKFSVPAGDDFVAVRVPFNTFSDHWSPATGDQTKTCADNKKVCLTPEDLDKILRIEVWAEGAKGDVHLELQSISAEKAQIQRKVSLASLAPAASATLITFDGAASTTFKFKELNDPVMGGKSVGTWSVNETGEFAVFDGEVVDVPFLKAPGFIKGAADGTFVSVADQTTGDLVLMVRSKTPEYTGFRVALAAGTKSPSYACGGGGSLPFSGGCYKAKFSVPAGDDFVAVRVPFNTFSDHWSPATGEQTKTCADSKDVCLTPKELNKILRIEVWAEGVAGKIHLELQSISAQTVQAQQFQVQSAVSASPPSEYNKCTGPIQSNLKYGISGRTEPTVPVPVNDTETLADAVCCDKRTLPFAEPRFLFQAPDISLYTEMDYKGVTVFYDSVCGLPLFQTPVNRTFADFQADTDEHGWPSFREAEIFAENIITDKATTYVTSKCGTHLGSYLPDENGPRWCMDLSCISGNKAQFVGAYH